MGENEGLGRRGRPAGFIVVLLLGWLPAAPAQSEDETSRPPCAGCCADYRTVPHPQPRLSQREAEFLGAATGLALGIALGKGGSGARAPSALTPVGGTDALVTGGALLLYLSPKLLKQDTARLPPPPADCDPSGRGVNAFDRKLRRLSLGDRSLEKRQLMSRLSWGTLTASLAQPVGLILSGDSPHKWSRDLPVWAEATGVSMAVNHAVKHLVHRERPYARFCEPQHDYDLCSPDAHLSFYSGHTGAAFAAAVAAGTIADMHRLPNRKWVWASGLTLATATAAFRVTADRHYATDVLAGAAAGGLAGWLIPKLHKPDPASVSATPAEVSRASAGPALAVPVVLQRRGSTVVVNGSFGAAGHSLQLTWQW